MEVLPPAAVSQPCLDTAVATGGRNPLAANVTA